MAREAADVCLHVLKESNKSRFNSHSCQEQCIEHVPYKINHRNNCVQLFQESLAAKMCTRQSRKVIWDMINTLFLTLWLSKLLLLLSFSTREHTSADSRVILSNFFEEQPTQNHPPYLSGLSRALFPTTFLEIAVYYRAFSLTWPASMQIYCNKRKRLHTKRVQLPQDWFGTSTWPPFHFFNINMAAMTSCEKTLCI